MEYFKRVSPESVGIESQGIRHFLEDVEKKGIELHSFMMIRHGQCCAAGWWKPYGPEYLHPLYSFSKTLTATAIGFAKQEGILSLEERLVDIFPEETPENPSPYLLKANLHHLLIMGCGHETEAECHDSEDWIRGFMHHPFLYEPGTFYKYNTLGTDMLGAVLKKKTGEDITEFLRPRLFEPLGIKEIVCSRMKDRDAVENGGAGMKIATEDMAKIAFFLLNRGKWEGRQLLEESWFDRACSKQIETAGDSEGHVKEWANGYGYQCWMGTLPGSFRADGAYGQFGFVYPSLDLVVVTTSATEQTQSIVDSMMEHLFPAVKESPLPESPETGLLQKKLADLRIPACFGDKNPVMEEKLGGRIFETTAKPSESGCSSMEILIGGAGLFDQEEGQITKMAFSFDMDTVTWKVWENGTEKEMTASFKNDFYINSCDGLRYAASARWRSINALEMEIRRLDAISGGRLIFRFGEAGLTLDVDDTLITASGLGIAQRHTEPFR